MVVVDFIDFIKVRAFPLFGTGQTCGLFFMAFMIFFGIVMLGSEVSNENEKCLSNANGNWQ